MFWHVDRESQPGQTPPNSTAHQYFTSPLPPLEENGSVAPPCTDEILYRRRLNLTAQSGDIVLAPHEADLAHETEENVQFLDENIGNIAGFKYVDGLMHSDTTTSTQMKDFLSRPVRIATMTWNESDLPGTLLTISPWHLYFNNMYVKLKTANFAFVRCNLKIKILINASPFYYGAMLCSYLPVPNITPSTVASGGGLSWFIPFSQRPHLWIYPANSEGGEMTLPFFWNKNWLSTQKAQDFSDMGILDFTAFTTLQSANGVSSAGVSVQVYAWAEDIELSGSSVGLVMQTDEYGDGVISKPASAVANLAGKMSKDPTIGRFATAAQIGASAVSRMASMFGFSNPPVIENTKMYRPTAFPQMSNTETCFPSEKLAMDPKNELSVDPSIVGLPREDTLDISKIAQHESYISQIAWATSDPVDTMLFSSYVTPEMFGAETSASQTLIHGTPLSYLSRMFNGWRGDIIFRFKFVATQYHKGRVRISWDPQGTSGSNLFNTIDTANVVQTAIVDLGKDTDVEFRVPFHQAYPWLIMLQNPSTSTVPYSIAPTRTWAANPILHNGCLTVRVATNLTAPVATSNVVMMVYVRGADNLEFANPGMLGGPYSQFTAQTSENQGISNDAPDTIVAGTVNRPDRERYLVNYGETITTLRSLLHRHYMTNVTQVAHATGNDNMTYTANFFRLPACYGYDPYGRETAKGLIIPANTYPFNYNMPDPIGWILSAFAAYRGSMVLTINPVAAGPLNHVRIMRNPGTYVAQYSTSLASSGYTTDVDTAYRNQVRLDNGAAGAAMTATRTQQGLTVILPQYGISKFESTSVLHRNIPQDRTASGYSAYRIQFNMSNAGSSQQSADTKIEWYYAGGTDLTPLFFVNVPTLFRYTSSPAP